jgi:CheY-like chemotaxis protein
MDYRAGATQFSAGTAELRGVADESRTKGGTATSGKPARQIRVKEILDPSEESPAPEQVLSTLSRLPHLASQPDPVAPPPPPSPEPRRRALLAEDNPVNSRVAVSILEKLGFQVDVVASGWEAIQAVERNEYTVVLMDCDAPATGGYHTVMELRSREQATGRTTPVIALTSYTMQWDRKEREAVGIDGYIAKPIQIDAMARVLGRITGARVEEAARPLLAIDLHVLSELGELAEGDHSRLREWMDLFLQSSAALLERMGTALAEGDLGTVSMAAHSLRGSSGQMGAGRMGEISAAVEVLAKAGTDHGIPELLEELSLAFERVREDSAGLDLARMLEAPPASGASTAKESSPRKSRGSSWPRTTR